MNLWDKKLGLFIIALTFFGCEEEIGNISLTPENNLGIFFAETSLADNVGQIWAGASPSSFSGRVMAGQYTDPVFGDITAKAFCDVSIGSVRYDTLTILTAQLQSMSMKLRIVDAEGTYSASDIQTLELYELKSPIQNLNNTNSSVELEFGEKIGEAQFELYPDSINLFTEAENPGTKYDANKAYIYDCKFEFIGKYKAEFLEKFKSAVLLGAAKKTKEGEEPDTDSVSYYLDQNVKGFVIKAKDENNAIISFNINDAASAINLKYTTRDTANNVTNNEGTFILNYLKSFSNITPNELSPWSNSVFNDISSINETVKPIGNSLHFQSGSNMLIDLDLSSFRNFKDTISENIIIQRAEVIISDPFDFGSYNSPPSSLGAFLTSLDSIATGNLNILGSPTAFTETASNLTYNSELKQYTLNIPLYLQALVDNKIEYDHIVIDANRVSTTSNGGKFTVNARDTNLRKVSFSKDKVKLRYYYSVPDKN